MRILALRRDSPRGRFGTVTGVVGPLVTCGLAILVAGLVEIFSSNNNDIVMLFGINAIMVIGFQLFVGNTGIVSFGHIAFMALGAYAAGIVSVPNGMRLAVLPSLPSWASTDVGTLVSLLIGGAVAMMVALVSGVVILRLSGASASIATLGLLVITNEVLSNASTFTRGPQAFFGVPQTADFAWVFLTLFVVVALSAGYKWSKAGLRSRAVRDAPLAAETSGVRRLPARLWPFMMSAFITGVAGALYAHYLGAFSPNSFYVAQIVGVLTMTIIGGLDSISGALVGSLVISALNWGLLQLENGVSVGSLHIPPAVDISQLVLGLVLIGVLRWRPAGLFGALELEIDPRPRRWLRSAPGATHAEAQATDSPMAPAGIGPGESAAGRLAGADTAVRAGSTPPHHSQRLRGGSW